MISYIPVKQFNPISFYNNFSNDPDIWNEGSEYAMETEDINFIRQYMLKGGRSMDFEYVITIAIRMNRADIVKELIKIDLEIRKHDNPVYIKGIQTAINNHYQDILELLIIPTFGDCNLRYFRQYAIEKKNNDAINFLTNRLTKI